MPSWGDDVSWVERTTKRGEENEKELFIGVFRFRIISLVFENELYYLVLEKEFLIISFSRKNDTVNGRELVLTEQVTE